MWCRETRGLFRIVKQQHAPHRSDPSTIASGSRSNAGRCYRKERPPRLVFVVTVSWYFISHRLALAEAALGAGYDVHVATRITDPDHVTRISRTGISVHSLEIGRGDSGVLYDLRSLFQLYRLYRRIRPDVVHHVAMKPVIFGGIAARAAHVNAVVQAIPGMGYVFIARDAKSRLRRSLLVMALRIACKRPGTAVILQNADDLAGIVDSGIISRDRAVLIPGSGVDTFAIDPRPEPPLPIRILLPGRMLREKGVVEFCDAAGRLRAEGVSANFLLAGMIDPANPGALSAAELESLTQRNGVEYLGFVDDMPALYRSCHIVCLPSYREGLPKALIEAAAAARPIVTTDCPGCRDVVRHEVNGLLVPVGESAPLASALRRLIDDPHARSRMGSAGRDIAQYEYDIGKIVDATLSVYRESLVAE